jgi:hypothetical protein
MSVLEKLIQATGGFLSDKRRPRKVLLTPLRAQKMTVGQA